MSLRTKMIIILSVFFVLFAVIDCAIHGLFILPRFLSIEEDEADKNLKRCISALNREIKNLGQFTNDWAAWDDTCSFIKKKNRSEYISTNLIKQTFTDNKLNLIFFFNSEGKKEWGEFRDWRSGETKADFDIGETTPFLINRADGHIEGVFLSTEGPVMISCRPIISSDRTGPVHGTLMMGRLLDKEIITQIAELTATDLEMFLVHGASEGRSGKIRAHYNDDEHFLTRSEEYADIFGEPVLLIKIRYFRNIASKGDSIIKESMLMTILAGSALTFILLCMIRDTIIIPINKLTSHALKIKESGNLIPISGYEEDGEIGLLYGAFESMVSQLARIHLELEKRVEDRTRKLGALNDRLRTEIARRSDTEKMLKKAKLNLEEQVFERTRDLVATNQKLIEEIDERLRSEAFLKIYHDRLVHMTSELTLAEERERRKIATGIHDCIGQTLTVAKMKVDLLGLKLSQPVVSESGNEALAISSMLEQAINDTRHFTFRLSPPVLHELGLVPAIEWLAENTEDEYGLRVIFEKYDFDENIDESLKILAFQAVRELVFNVFKHAEASVIKIEINKFEKHLCVIVEDNGRGFDYSIASAQSLTNGFGLFSIKERLSYAGGGMTVESSDGKGSRIAIKVPV